MKWTRLLGAMLFAACLIGTLADAALAVEPAFYECHKGAVGSGLYSNKTCSTLAEPGKGRYELQEGIGKERAFKGKAGKTTWHAPAVGAVMECQSATSEGVVSSPTAITEVVLKFSGCSSLSKRCTTAGQLAGTIKTNPLRGELGYISRPGQEVGIDLKAEAGTLMAEYNCEGLERLLSGSLIGLQTGDINSFSKDFTWTYEVNGEGNQRIRKFEGGPGVLSQELINGSGPFAAGIEGSFLNKGEELQIKA